VRAGIRLLACLAPALVAASPALALDPSALLGTWKYEKSALVGTATMYTVFSAGGLCAQVAKISIVGTTHWVTDRCSWSLEQSALSMKVLGSVTTPKQIGTSSTVNVDALSAEALAVSKDGNQQSWSRVPGVPDEYAAQLALETAGGAK
jgi:hypothetical protein